MYAYSGVDIFYRKVEEKVICLFSSGKHEISLDHTWVAIHRPKKLHSNYLFGCDTGSNMCLEVEEMIEKSCFKITLSQRCADWFLIKLLISGYNNKDSKKGAPINSTTVIHIIFWQLS